MTDPALVWARAFEGITVPRLGLAVSGGSDSVAMLLLACDWAQGHGAALTCFTVDHGLRDGSAADAAFVSDLCAALGVPCRVLRWTGWDGQGNKSARARQGRYQLMVQAARGEGIAHLALAHTRDDQAETVLAHLARKAGVDGLAAMAPVREAQGITWLRPLLSVGRQVLRDYLTARGQDWRDDPSNDDPAYDRVRLRQAAGALTDLGLTPEALAEVAANMRHVQAALDAQVLAAAGLCTVRAGAVCIDRAGFDALPEEIRRRLLAGSLRWLTGADYPPRRAPLIETLGAVKQDQAQVLAGALVLPKPKAIWLCREPAAVLGLQATSGTDWDGRWRVSGPFWPDDVIRALGDDGLREVPNWREKRLPRQVLATTPAVWRENRLIAAPLAGYGDGWTADLRPVDADYHKALVKR